MTNLDIWQQFVGEDSPEDFMRTFGSMDPELCVSRFLEDRGHLYGVVNQGSWQDTFQAEAQHHRYTVRLYLLSYLDETREEWEPALEAKPPSIPRRYREKFDQDKYPPPPAKDVDDTPDVGDDTGEPASEASDGGVDAATADGEPRSPAEGVVETASGEAQALETGEAEPADTDNVDGAPEPDAAEPEAAPAVEPSPDGETDDQDATPVADTPGV